MIKFPVVGMQVKVIPNGKCCRGAATGEIGTIINVHSADSFEVAVTKDTTWWHCRDCVTAI